jgi:hypothetical protein
MGLTCKILGHKCAARVPAMSGRRASSPLRIQGAEDSCSVGAYQARQQPHHAEQDGAEATGGIVGEELRKMMRK